MRNPMVVGSLVVFFGVIIIVLAVISAGPFVDALAGVAAGLLFIVLLVLHKGLGNGTKRHNERHNER